MSAAAKHCAARERPAPGGPVNSQEWLMARGSPSPRAARAALSMVWATEGALASLSATLEVFTRSSLLG